MNTEERRELREYAWKYFAIHAEQRLKVFSFFIIFASLTIGGFSTLVGKNGLESIYSILLLLLAFLAFIFWKFEERTKMLIKNGEDALKFLDQQSVGLDSPLALFNQDDEKTNNLKKWAFDGGYFSYSRVFRWVYMVFGFGGLSGFIYAILMSNKWVKFIPC